MKQEITLVDRRKKQEKPVNVKCCLLAITWNVFKINLRRFLSVCLFQVGCLQLSTLHSIWYETRSVRIKYILSYAIITANFITEPREYK